MENTNELFRYKKQILSELVGIKGLNMSFYAKILDAITIEQIDYLHYECLKDLKIEDLKEHYEEE